MNKLFEKFSIPILSIIIIFHGFILTKLIFFPYQELFTYPYLTNNGIFPYSQNFDQHFPGFLMLPVNLATFGIDTPAEMRVLAITVISLIHALIFVITRQITRSSRVAIMSNILFLAWHPFFEGWVLWIDNFLPLLLLPAFFFIFNGVAKRNTVHLLFAGLLLGFALIFKQTILPLTIIVALAILVFSKKISYSIALLTGFFPFGLFLLAYFQLNNALNDFWYWTVVYNFTIFSKYGQKPATFTQLVRIISVFGFPIFGFLSKFLKQMFWLSIFIIGSLASAITRADFVHFQPALPFVAIASGIAIEHLISSRKYLLIAFYILGGMIFLTTFYKGHLGSKVFFFDKQTYQIATRIKQYTNPKQQIFIYGASPHLYQLSNTLPAGDIYVQQFSWFMMVAEDKMLDGLKKSDPDLVIADTSVDDGLYNIKQYAPKTYEYIQQNYIPIDNINSTQFLRKK